MKEQSGEPLKGSADKALAERLCQRLDPYVEHVDACRWCPIIAEFLRTFAADEREECAVTAYTVLQSIAAPPRWRQQVAHAIRSRAVRALATGEAPPTEKAE